MPCGRKPRETIGKLGDWRPGIRQMLCREPSLVVAYEVAVRAFVEEEISTSDRNRFAVNDYQNRGLGARQDDGGIESYICLTRVD